MAPERIKSKRCLRYYTSPTALLFTSLLLMQPAVAQVRRSAQTSNPLLGQWHCTSTAMRMPAFKNIPPGSVTQSISYSADAQGRWISNSVLQYQADKSSHRLRIHSTASGVHVVSGTTITEQIQRFQISPAADPSSEFAQAMTPVFHNLLTSMVQRNGQQRYRLLQKTPTRYVMQPLTNSGTGTNQRITCQKVGTP